MDAKAKFLNPHDVFGDISFDEYCSRIPQFYFRKGVPDDVIKNFEVVEKMLALSFYEYKLIDEAYAKSIHSFEMAMAIRYKDFHSDKKKYGFNTLINKLTELNLFDTNLETLKQVKWIRNYYSHPDRHSFGGMIVWNRIEFIVRLVNEMYEDVNLRLERFELAKLFIQKVQEEKLDGPVVMEIQDQATLLYKIQLLLINNKHKPHAYVFACTPLFDLKEDEGSIKAPFIFKAKLISPKIEKGVLQGISFKAGAHVKFSDVTKHKFSLREFEKWNTNYSNVRDKWRFESGLNFNIPEIYIPEVQEFQKM